MHLASQTQKLIAYIQIHTNIKKPVRKNIFLNFITEMSLT